MKFYIFVQQHLFTGICVQALMYFYRQCVYILLMIFIVDEAVYFFLLSLFISFYSSSALRGINENIYEIQVKYANHNVS